MDRSGDTTAKKPAGKAADRTTLKLAAASVLVGAGVFALKYLAYVMTGSVALYSDALETVVNVLAALAALWAIHVAGQPADAEHPFGHYKAEYFSAWLEGALIALAAAAILYEAWHVLFAPRKLAWNDPGLLVNAAAGVINGVWSWVLIRAGRRHRSPALEADGRHLRADVYTSIGVLAGVMLAGLTGWYVLDPILAILVALHILHEGWKLLWESTQGLMDVAPDEETLEKIRRVIADNARGALEFHDLRARRAGPALFIELHLVVPGDMRVRFAHDICDNIERALKEAFGEVHASIHVEPEHEKTHGAHGGVQMSMCRPCMPARAPAVGGVVRQPLPKAQRLKLDVPGADGEKA